MKYLFLLLLITLVLTTRSNAQRLFFLFGHAEYASSLGKLSDTHDKGLGVEAGLGIGTNKTFFTGTLGYTWLQSKDNAAANTTGNLRYSPIKVGVRRYIFRRNVFVKGDAGLANMKPEHSDGTSHFTAGLGAGIKFTGFEAMVDYTTVTKWGSWVSVKAGFTIGL